MGNIAFHGCECKVGKWILRLVFDWVGSINGQRLTESHDCKKRKICVEYQQEGIDHPLGEKPVNYSQT